MTNQTTPLGLGRTDESRIDGYPLGRSRTGSCNALAGVSWGSQVQFGRVIVYSPEYNAAVAAGVETPTRTVMVPDAAGDYLRDPASGLLLSTNATLLAQGKVNDEYRVAGIAIEGDRCDETRCDRPELWPVGDCDNLHEWNFAQNRRPVTIGHRGYYRVRIGEDVNVGDALAFVDVTDNADPNVGVQALGSIVLAGNGVQDLPTSWEVITGGKAGGSAEIYIR